MASDATTRFTNRVADYVKARPGYPTSIIDLMKQLGLRREHAIADVGSGTGILTAMLLREGCTVFAVEPNAAMRSAAQEILGSQPGFRSIEGSAETTNLQPQSIDFVAAAQAFHWFDPDRARSEFLRILKPRGYVVLIWNDRRMDRPPFSVEYESILKRFNTDMNKVHHRNVTDKHNQALDRLFQDAGYQTRSFDNHQDLDWEGVRSRMLSSSYMPPADDPRSKQVLAALKSAFDAHQSNGIVRLEYDTRVYYGRLK
jgi:SAM-dependent methyltransferase